MRQLWTKPVRIAAGALMLAGITIPTGMASAHGVAKHQAASTATVVFSDNQFPDTLNPLEAGATVDIEVMSFTLPGGDTVDFNGSGGLVARQLTKVPTVNNGLISKDGKTITLDIKPGQTWSNGQPITSQDVKFGWQVEMNPLVGDCTGTCDHIKSISTPNKNTAVLHMKDVYGAAVPTAFPVMLPHAWSKLGGSPAAAAKIESDVNFTYEGPDYVVAGPYVVSEFVNNNRIVLTPNKKYKGPFGAAKFSKAIFLFYSDVDTEIAGAAKHETDVTTDYTLAQYPQLLSHKAQFKTMNVSAISPEHFEINVLDKTVNGSPNPLVNQKVRQAINLAIDRYGIQKSVFGVSNKKLASNLFTYDAPLVLTPTLKSPYADPKITGAWDPIAKAYVPYSAKSLADAKKLLKGTPCASGCTVHISSTTLPQRAAEAGVVIKNLSKIGINADFTAIPSSTYFGTYDKGGTLVTGKFEMGLFAYTNVPPDPDTWKTDMGSQYIARLDPAHQATDKNYSGLRDKIVDTAFKKGAATFNKAVRRKYYYQAQEEIAKQVPWIDLSIRPIFCTYDNKVTGLAPNGFQTCMWNAAYGASGWRPTTK